VLVRPPEIALGLSKRALPLLTVLATGCIAGPAAAQPLSYWLGAYKLDGLSNYTACMNEARGFRETLIADRLEEKLGVSAALTPAERDVWVANVTALRAVVRDHAAFRAPDPKNPNKYLDGLTEDEFRAIHSMSTRFSQEVELKCQDLYGDIAARSVGEKTESQRRLEAGLRARMVEPTDVKTLPLAALPSPFPKEEPNPEEELAALRAASRANTANAQATMNRLSECTAAMTGIRWSMMADKMQERLSAASGLPAERKAAWEADLGAVRRAGTGNLPMVEAVDPANPYRFMTWLSAEDQTAIGTEYAARMTTHMATCTGN
jgi:hypothetical protein